MRALVGTLNDISAAWEPLIWKASWQGGLALLIVFSLWRLPAQFRCWLWRLAFLKLLIVGVWSAPIELPWLPNPTENKSREPAIATTTPIEMGDPAVNWLAPDGFPAPRSVAPPAMKPASWLLIGWLAGVGILLVRLMRQWIGFRRQVPRLQPVSDELFKTALAENCRRMGVRRLPDLRQHPASNSPYLVGIVRPVIVLPTAVLRASTGPERDAALLHELAHIKRRDLLWNWLPALAEMLFFFHPLVWLSRRHWRLGQEIASDELAIARSHTSAADYAKSLLGLIAKCPAGASSSHLAIGMSPGFYQLERRMIAMQSFQPERLDNRRRVAGLISTIILLGIVPWKLVAQEASTITPMNATAPDVATHADDGAVDAPADTASGKEHGVVVDSEGKPAAEATVADIASALSEWQRNVEVKSTYRVEWGVAEPFEDVQQARFSTQSPVESASGFLHKKGQLIRSAYRFTKDWQPAAAPTPESHPGMTHFRHTPRDEVTNTEITLSFIEGKTDLLGRTFGNQVQIQAREERLRNTTFVQPGLLGGSYFFGIWIDARSFRFRRRQTTGDSRSIRPTRWPPQHPREVGRRRALRGT